jgi:Fe2+ or Zn2+ uptake regulation protein
MRAKEPYVCPSPDDAHEAFGNARVSPQRRAIIGAVLSLTRAFTVDELAEATRSRDRSAGTATVYRAVAALEANGWLEQVGKRGECALYARCSGAGNHHHHVICEGCGRVEVTACPVVPQPPTEAGADEDPRGFLITRHEVTMYGYCPQCAASRRKGE